MPLSQIGHWALFFLGVVLVVMFVLFFPPRFSLETLEKVSQEVSYVLGLCLLPPFKLCLGSSCINKIQLILGFIHLLLFAPSSDLSLLKMRPGNLLSPNPGRSIVSWLLAKFSLLFSVSRCFSTVLVGCLCHPFQHLPLGDVSPVKD